jgi:hypothetical protein
LKEHYRAFIRHNRDVIVEDELPPVFGGLDSDIRAGTEALRKAIETIIDKRDTASRSRLARIGNFIGGLYPIAQISLSLFSGVISVVVISVISNPQIAPFGSRMQIAGNVVGVILRVPTLLSFQFIVRS